MFQSFQTFKSSRTKPFKLAGTFARFENSQNVEMTPLGSSVVRGALPHQETDLPLLGLRWRHELPDRVKDNFKLLIVLVFDGVEPAREFFVRSEELPQAHKGSHDFDIDLYGTLAPENTGQHRHALLRERVGRGPTEAATT